MPYLGNEAAEKFVSKPAVDQFSGDGSTTAFTLSFPVASDQDILVSVDGVIQDTSAYAVSNGTTLTFTAAPSSNSGNNIFVNYLARVSATIAHPATSALTATTGTFTDTVGIGTTSPSAPVHISGDAAGNNHHLRITNTATDGYSSIQLFDAQAGIYRAGSGVSAYGGASSLNLITVDSHPITLATSNTVRMTVHGAGYVTNATNPVFFAYRNSTSPTNSIVVFDQTYGLNIGSHYDTSNGKFTAPVAGSYAFTASTLANPVSVTRINFRHNGNARGAQARLDGGTLGGYAYGTIQVILNLAATDYVEVFGNTDNGSTAVYSDSTPFLSFGGHLIG